MEVNGQISNETEALTPSLRGPERQYMNQSQYARYRGLSQPRLSAMVKAGQLEGAFLVEPSGRYKIDVAKADEIIEGARDPRHDERLSRQRNLFTGGPEVKRKRRQSNSRLGTYTLQGGGRQSRTYAEANALEKSYKAELARLDYEKKLGALVAKEEVDRQAQEIGKMIRAHLEAIPNKLAPVVAGLSSPVEVAEVLKTEINQLLQDLSSNVASLPFG
jgi:hypothetical protein